MAGTPPATARAAQKGITMVGGNTNLASKTEPELPDDDGGAFDADTAIAAAMLSVSMAAKCFKADPKLGDPVVIAQRFYDFIFG